MLELSHAIMCRIDTRNHARASSALTAWEGDNLTSLAT